MSVFSVDKRQAGILSDRYLDVILGEPSGLVLLLVQAPLIGVGIGGVWSNVAKDTLTLYFVLCLSAFFLGAANAAREIVKERQLYLRERMYNLNPGAYLLSKFRVLAIFVVVQCVSLAAVVASMVTIEVNAVALSACLVLVALVGTAIGLLISAFVESPDRAVAMVPLVVIPQILFSDFVLGEKRLTNWTETAQRLMPVTWAYELLRELRLDRPEWLKVAAAPGVMAGMIAIASILALLRLASLRY